MGTHHACAASGGKAYCWGGNGSGELGQNTADANLHPKPLEVPLDQVTDVAVGAEHSCALSNKRIYCWGNNTYGQIGDGSGNALVKSPVASHLNVDLASIAVGTIHTCALSTSGEAYCWGSNASGQLGINQQTSTFALPQKIEGNHFTSLSAGPQGQNTCGVTPEGTIKCWGDNTFAQVTADGVASNTLYYSPFAVPPTPGPVAKLSVGNQFVCVLQNGLPNCWGNNMSSQQGTGSVGTTPPA